MLWCNEHQYVKRTCPWCEIRELEAEIERLQSEVSRLRLRDSLLEQLHAQIADYFGEGGLAKLQDGVYALKAEIERLKEGRRWIPIEERLPEYNLPVFVSVSGKVYTATLFNASGTEYWSVNNRGNSDDPSTKVERVRAVNITHWMPLPDPPEVTP